MSAYEVLQRGGLAALFALVLAGCGPKESSERVEEERTQVATENGVSFNAKSGLLIPSDTAKFIGLEIVDVTERSVTSTLRFSASVYRLTSAGTNGTAFASAFINKSDAAQLRKGHSLTIEPNAGKAMTGEVTGFGAQSGKNGSVAEVLVEIADASGRLSVRDHVEAVAAIGKAQAGLSVPRTALLQTLEGGFVYTISGERVIRTAVKIGAINDEFVEITEGLYEGDKVAVKPTMTLWLAELQSIRGGKACADGH